MYLKKMKEELKAMAAAIPVCKREFKEWQRRQSAFICAHPNWNKYPHPEQKLYREFSNNPVNSPWRAWNVSPYEYRRLHIAYCLLRGRTYEQIEPKVHECNKLTKWDWEKINKIVQEGNRDPGR